MTDAGNEVAGDPVIALSGILGSTVRSTLAGAPDVLDRMAAIGARIVLFEPWPLAIDEDIDARLQRAVLAADAEVGARVQWPIFVAEMHLHHLVRAGRIAFREGFSPRAFQVHPPRGVFAGIVAIGEGGLAYVPLDGQVMRVAPLDELRAILAAHTGG